MVYGYHEFICWVNGGPKFAVLLNNAQYHWQSRYTYMNIYSVSQKSEYIPHISADI